MYDAFFFKKRPRDHFCPHKATQRRLWGAFFTVLTDQKIGLPFTFPSVFILFHRLTLKTEATKTHAKKACPKRKEVVQIITQAYKHII